MASRSAYTLIEVMLVMLVMVILTSLAASPLMQSWRDQRTGSATEDVRAILAGTRILALDRDETWQFVFEPGGTHYLRVPLTVSVENASDGSANRGKYSGTLPSDIKFGQSSAGAASTVSSELLTGLTDAGELSGVSWSAPVLFYSDGTSSEAKMEIVDGYGNSREISVRDLTGGVTVKEGASLQAAL
ncbi:MAG: prepilin-type N-terminal cleavage/methylation domain-containing protein [Rhodopirellula sp.]|jgi:prepilin-type N-terminal cleavage/methylation domain-containing protein|nr:prepilin-type N-terminal cleavage/methylation domain-containing protein [Rhodopirellula sp.]